VNRAKSIRFNFSATVNRFTLHVEHSTKRRISNRNGNWSTGVMTFCAPTQTVSTTQCNTSNPSAAKVLGDFAHKRFDFVADWNLQRHRVVNLWQVVFRKYSIESRTNDLRNFSNVVMLFS
jgi:hypothetical protein